MLKGVKFIYIFFGFISTNSSILSNLLRIQLIISFVNFEKIRNSAILDKRCKNYSLNYIKKIENIKYKI